MFNNNFNQGVGHAAHRCPHHLEPGIPLFDYEDHEGWIVFDPTTDAMWQAFDEKPEIENIKITLYTKFDIFGWYKEYGIAKMDRLKYLILVLQHRVKHIQKAKKALGQKPLSLSKR